MILDEIAKLITDNTTTRVAGTSLFTAFNHPNVQDTATFIYETQGVGPTRVFGSSAPAFENPGIQIIDRSSDYDTARNSAELIYKILQGQANVTLLPAAGTTGTLYLTLEPQQSPFSIGQDDNDRSQISCNYLISKELST